MAKTINLKFDGMGKDELRSACKAAGITGYGKLSNLQMRDALKAAYAEPAAQDVVSETAPSPKPAKVAKQPKAPAELKDQQNGIARPGAGTACRKVWNALDVLHVEGNATAANVLKELPDINPATARTQYQRWRQFNGVQRAPLAA